MTQQQREFYEKYLTGLNGIEVKDWGLALASLKVQDERRIEQLLDVEEEIQRCFKLSSSMSNIWQEALMNEKNGAKWLLETLKNKANDS